MAVHLSTPTSNHGEDHEAVWQRKNVVHRRNDTSASQAREEGKQTRRPRSAKARPRPQITGVLPHHLHCTSGHHSDCVFRYEAGPLHGLSHAGNLGYISYHTTTDSLIEHNAPSRFSCLDDVMQRASGTWCGTLTSGSHVTKETGYSHKSKCRPQRCNLFARAARSLCEALPGKLRLLGLCSVSSTTESLGTSCR
jgi:hypothetical protein